MILALEEEIRFCKVHHMVPYTGQSLGGYQGVLFVLGHVLSESEEARIGKCFDRFDLQIHRQYGKVFSAKRKGKDLVIVVTAPGAALASRDFERYLCHGPANFGIGIGLCGGLQPYLRKGEVVVPTEAIRGEGTSFHYYPSRRWPPFSSGAKLYHAKPDQAMSNSLTQNLQVRNLAAYQGSVYSTDVPLMETSTFTKKLQTEGLLGIDMEISAFFASASFHKKAVTGALVVDDNQSISHDIYFLWPNKDIRLSKPDRKTGLPEVMEAAIETLIEHV